MINSYISRACAVSTGPTGLTGLRDLLIGPSERPLARSLQRNLTKIERVRNIRTGVHRLLAAVHDEADSGSDISTINRGEVTRTQSE